MYQCKFFQKISQTQSNLHYFQLMMRLWLVCIHHHKQNLHSVQKLMVIFNKLPLTCNYCINANFCWIFTHYVQLLHFTSYYIRIHEFSFSRCTKFHNFPARFQFFLHIAVVLIMYVWAMGNKIGITIYFWTLCLCSMV